MSYYSHILVGLFATAPRMIDIYFIYSIDLSLFLNMNMMMKLMNASVQV